MRANGSLRFTRGGREYMYVCLVLQEKTHTQWKGFPPIANVTTKSLDNLKLERAVVSELRRSEG